MSESAGTSTVTVSENFLPPTVAETTVSPTLFAVRTPCAETEATDGLELLHLTLSFVPLTVSICFCPLIIVVFSVTSCGSSAKILQVYVLPSYCAVIVAVPAFFTVTTPVLLTDATAVLLDVHFTVPSAPFNTSVVFVPATMRLTVLFSPIVSAACAVRAVPNGRHSTDAESISAIRKTVRIWLLLPFLVSLFKKIPPPFFADLRLCNQIPM